MKKNELEGVRRHRLRRWAVPGVLMLAGALAVGWVALGNRGPAPTVASPDAASLPAGPLASTSAASAPEASAADAVAANAAVTASAPASTPKRDNKKLLGLLSPEELDHYEKQ